MVRVAGLKRRDEMGLSVRSADGLSPREQLRRIGERTQQVASRHAAVFLDSVRPALADEGIAVLLAERFPYPALRLAGRACLMVSGRIVAEGGAAEVAVDSRLVPACTGELSL